MIKELDCVALATDLPGYGFAVDDVGAVVHVFEGGRDYQVEFADRKSTRLNSSH